jgi:competence protein ComEC
LVEYGDVGFLFPGDATAKSETGMIAYRTVGECEVLKVGHHGSKYSSSADFLAVVEPVVSVIEVGENDYGHPAESTVGRLEGYGSVYTTYDHAVVVTTDGSGVSVATA